MCGIAGIIYKNNEKPSKKEIKDMTDIIFHRGPDDEGFYFGENFAFGHRRLAILDLSKAGHQPMEYKGKNGEYVIVYNGEIYNYIELRKELIKEGYKFMSDTDTEVILASYDKWGVDCLNRLNGMWAFAIYDKKKNIIFCSRDRFGIKPFYYAIINNKFVFTSEIKQFTQIIGWKPTLNPFRAFDFLNYGITNHTNETLFKGVFQLKGGFYLIYYLNRHKFEIYQWYDLPVYIDKNIPFEEATIKFKELLTDSIKLRLRSDVNVGTCLSGGLDSSVIVSIISKVLGYKDIETVSSCFTERKFDEQEFIDEVVKQCNIVSHKTFPVFDDVFTEIEKIIWHQDEPFASLSIFAQWNVFKLAKDKNLKVMLDGQGADEILAGYHSFYGAYLIYLLKNFKLKKFLKEFHSIKELHNYSNKYLLALILKNVLSGKFKEHLRNIYTKKSNFFNYKFMRNDYERKYFSIKDMSYHLIRDFSIPKLLHYEDRNSMAFSIEARVPFLDYRLVEFIFSLPDEFKIRDGQTKYILRKALNDILPEKIIKRYDKMGFVTPEEIWLKENNATILQELKDTVANSNGLINERIIKYYENFIKGRVPYNHVIWRTIVFNRWIKMWGVNFG